MNKIQAHDAVHNEGGEGYNPEHAKDEAAAGAKSEAHIADLLARADEIRPHGMQPSPLTRLTVKSTCATCQKSKRWLASNSMTSRP